MKAQNKTTQVRNIVSRFGTIYEMYNDKRKDGTRRLKFVLVNKVASVDEIASLVNDELKAQNIEASASKFISNGTNIFHLRTDCKPEFLVVTY